MASPSEDQTTATTTAKEGDSDGWVTEEESSYIPQPLVDENNAQFCLVGSQHCWGVWREDTQVFANLSQVDNRHVRGLPRINIIKKDLPETSEQDKVAQLCLRMHKAAYLSGCCDSTRSTGKCWVQHNVETFTSYAKSLTLAAAGESDYEAFNWDGRWLSGVEKSEVLWLKPTSKIWLDPTCLTAPCVTREDLQESRPNYKQTDATTADLGRDRSL